MTENPSYYAVIPANVRYAKIKANAKLLYGEITALTNKKGYCYASNAYFAELYEVTEKQVKIWLRELEAHNFITSVVIKEFANKRFIFLGVVDKEKVREKLITSNQKVTSSAPKGYEGSNQKVTTYNNTMNNTNNIKKEKEKFDAEKYVQSLELDQSLIEALLSWLEIRKAKKTATTQKAIDLALKKISSLSLAEKIEVIERSVMNGWTGLFINTDKKQESYSSNLGSDEYIYSKVSQDWRQDTDEFIKDALYSAILGDIPYRTRLIFYNDGQEGLLSQYNPKRYPDLMLKIQEKHPQELKTFLEANKLPDYVQY